MRKRSHRFRAIRNLLLTALVLTVLWWYWRCPLPTPEMELHRGERQNLLDRSAIVFSCESEGERISGDRMMLVGVSKHTVQTRSRTHPFNVWPRNPDGATLVVLPSELRYRPTMIAGLVAAEPPARAVRAKLTLDMTAYEQGGVYMVEGERDGEVFLFRVEETPEREQVLDNLFHTTDLPPYALEFFDKDGVLLDTVTNIEGG